MNGHTWKITDSTIVDAIRAAGFSCQLDGRHILNPAIPLSWYRTTLPMSGTMTYSLNGRILLVSGARLLWKEDAPEELYDAIVRHFGNSDLLEGKQG